MSHLTKAHFAFVAVVVALGAGMMPAPVEAARLSKADKIALKQAIVACKAEATGRKVKWLARRKYVNNCVSEALKEHPNVDVIRLIKEYPNITSLPVEKWPGF
ncbi:hypothetical protein HAP48_0033680 [Bradyrhizobium septentrionale]|nr:hypothetical protein [Bradyrhizobium septentrionale]UGY13502.1 hypothetical protein HAP48_0033680 [Bradyrhizobium septentrionale]